MGNDFMRKRKDHFLHTGDVAVARISAPTLLRDVPPVVSAEYSVRGGAPGCVVSGDTVGVEVVGGHLRTVAGCQAVGIVDAPRELYEAVVAHGGIATADVVDCSPFGDFSIRIREEEE